MAADIDTISFVGNSRTINQEGHKGDANREKTHSERHPFYFCLLAAFLAPFSSDPK